MVNLEEVFGLAKLAAPPLHKADSPKDGVGW
jgi:hypothetical protein